MPSTRTKNPRKYQRTYLAQVLSRIDFAAELPFAKRGPAPSIHKSIKKEFPIVGSEEMSKRTVLLGEGKPTEEIEVYTEWAFYGQKRDKVVKINRDMLMVEYQNHQSYDNLRRDFLAVAGAIFKEYKDTQGQRLGLRYINRIQLDEGKPTEWSKYLHPDLLGIFRLADEPTTFSRAFHVAEFNYGDSNLRFQYGMPNPDYPAQIRQKLFVLDFDAYCNLSLSIEEIAAQLDFFHERINRAFEQVITENLRKTMRSKHGK